MVKLVLIKNYVCIMKLATHTGPAISRDTWKCSPGCVLSVPVHDRKCHSRI